MIYEMISLFCASIALVTLIIVIIILWRISHSVIKEPLTEAIVLRVLREETDNIRKFSDENSCNTRREIADGLRGAQDSTINSVGVLSTGLNNQIRDFGERLDAGLTAVELRVGLLGEKLDSDISQMGETAEQNRSILRIKVEEKLDAALANQTEMAKNLREELGLNFHRLGGNITSTLSDMSNQQKERLALTTTALTVLGERHERSSEALKLAVEGRLDHLRQENSTKLDEMRQTVDEKLQSTLETRLGESFSRVVEQLNRVYEGLGEMKNLAANVGDLKNVLTNVKVRGTFGEVQLEMILEQFLAREQYIKDAKVREHSSERVEFAIRMPGSGQGYEVLIPIDAKFPREVYDRLIDASQAGDEENVKIFRKQLEAQVRGCAKIIFEKYVNPPLTTDFAILFLPTEGLYAEVLRQPGVFEGIQREFHVTLAGPTTLSAILNALQMGFRSLAIERRSSEVWQILGAVQTEFGKYNSVVEKLGKQLSTAAQSVDTLGRRTRAMNRRLRLVESTVDGKEVSGLLGFDGEDVGSLEIDPVLSGRDDTTDAIKFSDTVVGTV